MSTQEVFVQQFVRLFQHYQQTLSLETHHDAASWKTMPADERNRMVAAARLAVLELETNSKMEEDARRYYATPGEAEWGC